MFKFMFGFLAGAGVTAVATTVACRNSEAAYDAVNRQLAPRGEDDDEE